MSNIDQGAIAVTVKAMGKRTLTITPKTRGNKTVSSEVWLEQSIKNMQSSFVAEGVSFSDKEAEALMVLASEELSA